MGLVDVASDKPAHGAACYYIRSKVLPGSNPRCADYSGQTVGGDRDDWLVLVLMGQEGGDGPYLDRMSGRKRSPAAPKLAGIFLVGSIATRGFLQNSSHNQSVQQRFGSQHADLARLRVISPHSVGVRAGDDWDERVRCADV